MQRIKSYTLIMLVIFLIFFTVACRPQERPEEQRQEETPPIPEEISQGEGNEPRLKVYIADTGEIKEMAFEEYLEGVLAGEMHNDWPEEALAAQAILARSFVMEFITDKGGSKYEGAHVSTDIEEAQAWDAEQINDRIKEAVNRTRGMVAVHNNEYIKAWFHAHAGGKTATAQEGLGFDAEEPPYIQVIESPDSEEAPEDDVNWSETFTKAEIIQALQEQGQEASDFNTIEVAETGPSGRATVLQIGDATVNAPAFRIALDSTRMKSTMIRNISVEGDQVTIEGTGYGHGVGMSQWGAYQMANDGKSAEEIVTFYFKDVNIINLWD
ncbi:SpoIID/LytB domain-containing protein [Alkaliphilus peptidifermentans]|uniref:Stage II sporulation protein D n=1 Tax=Alkaliphilus peptidifermentans DSM 18978 TaxID=1120976 RepID=A0A1G5AJZ2_9FIRM|nr:SpoIID/LytB domain-containing protein [Alkaliphilus peptidifermentans]SCX78165.1 stage II sporulation protein D [Alkaliphilus peptidifermentans DSM 18978]